MSTPSDPLNSLIARSRAVPPPPAPSVAPEVWRRIRVASSAAPRSAWWARAEAVFAQPAFAVAFVAACMLGGLFLAEMRVSRLQAERNLLLARSYVRMITPLLDSEPLAVRAAPPQP
jgi:hypothetical protein